MFVITNKEISDQLYNTSWEHDYQHYCRVMADIAQGREPSKNDANKASYFADIMNAGIEAYKSHKNIASYYAIREALTDSVLTPEEIDYGIAGNVKVGSIDACKNIDFDAIASMGYIPRITKIVSNAPDTVVYFNDGDKVVVTCQPDETFDTEKGIYICLLKKALGSKNLRHLFSLIEKAKPVAVKNRTKTTRMIASDNKCESCNRCIGDCEECELTECVALDDRFDDDML